MNCLLKAGHSPLFRNGIFGTLEGKPIVKVEKLSNLEQITRNGGIHKNLKSKTQSVDSNLRLRCEGSGKTKDLPTSAPRFEARNETRNPRRGERGMEILEHGKEKTVVKVENLWKIA
ncbi:hypothetical protein AVEN_27828-1 [Araneus ventricosus]|uniref:Uncharacterized protein n=1 Tax=Araneus ventricosus TaxID=182803 RepID=A0A4Y2GP39_ARAVE|nr:hypothetical protein AVEN_27828-1 [Araneus ventricosus]